MRADSSLLAASLPLLEIYVAFHIDSFIKIYLVANVSNLKVAVFPKNQADLRRADFVAKQRAMEDSLMALEVLLLQKMDSVFHMMCYMTIYLFTSSAFISDCTRFSIFLLFSWFLVFCGLLVCQEHS